MPFWKEQMHRKGAVLKHLWRSMRPAHWIKNLFILLPVIFGKKLFEFPENAAAIFAVFVFSLASSAAYLINDGIDIESDRLHPVKRNRPMAATLITKTMGKQIALLLAGISLLLAGLLNVYFGTLVFLYLLLNFIYSKVLKQIVLVDVFCIAAFFLIRIIAGGMAAGVHLSHWIVIMVTLLALFLGFAKRRNELYVSEAPNEHRQVLINYDIPFIDQIITVLMASIGVTYMLYTFDARTVAQFGNTHLIYSIPFVYYGLFRYLYLVHKMKGEADPTNILLTDKTTQINILLWIVICMAVIYL